MSDKDHHSHLRVRYYRPRTMGGDTQHPLCRQPRIGWAGPRYACWPMTDQRSRVDCPWCLSRMAGVSLSNSDPRRHEPRLAVAA